MCTKLYCFRFSPYPKVHQQKLWVSFYITLCVFVYQRFVKKTNFPWSKSLVMTADYRSATSFFFYFYGLMARGHNSIDNFSKGKNWMKLRRQWLDWNRFTLSVFHLEILIFYILFPRNEKRSTFLISWLLTWWQAEENISMKWFHLFVLCFCWLRRQPQTWNCAFSL